MRSVIVYVSLCSRENFRSKWPLAASQGHSSKFKNSGGKYWSAEYELVNPELIIF